MVGEHEPAAENNSYLERNARIISELKGRGFVLNLGNEVGSGLSRRFHSAGYLYSEVIGREIHVGVKRLRDDIDDQYGEVAKINFFQELTIIAAISKHFPDLVDQLPLFCGLLTHRNGETLGMITEDFSEGGKYEVYRRAPAAYKVKAIFADGSVNDDDIEKMGFRVNGERKLGDFWPMGNTKENYRRFGKDLIEQRAADFTFRIGYSLV